MHPRNLAVEVPEIRINQGGTSNICYTIFTDDGGVDGNYIKASVTYTITF